ncbi:hypothetical protein B5C26_05160 [Photorhabdus luminescens]|nr:hypothetical protein B5C26_05160 [Photorhabdus luminescens]
MNRLVSTILALLCGSLDNSANVVPLVLVKANKLELSQKRYIPFIFQAAALLAAFTHPSHIVIYAPGDSFTCRRAATRNLLGIYSVIPNTVINCLLIFYLWAEIIYVFLGILLIKSVFCI